MASETESLTTMQQAFQKAGMLDVERAQRLNRIKHSEDLKKQSQQSKPNTLKTVKKLPQNRKPSVQKVG